jgi:NAD(P)-dependent dehydrogenase (short-subunit alcohol dehydrogenase family)
MQTFAGTVAFITGAGSGIGRALAEALATRAAGGLALADVNAAGLDETANALGRLGLETERVSRHVFDVTDAAAFRKAAKEALAAHGVIDILVNNAGQLARMATFVDLEDGEFERSFGVNFWGAVHGSRALVPHLLTRPEAALVNVSSAYGFAATPLQSPYIAGKFALRGFTDALRYELLASQVHVMCVHPGVVKTNLGANAPARSEAERQANIKRQTITLTTAPRAARKILAGIERRKARVVIGADGKFMDLLGRYAPARYPQLTYPLLRRVEPLIGEAVNSCAADRGRAR